MDPYTPHIDTIYSSVLKEFETIKPDFKKTVQMLKCAKQLVQFRTDYYNFRDSLFLDLTVD